MRGAPLLRDRVVALLDYDQATGRLMWKDGPDAEAGWIGDRGYRIVEIDGKPRQSARVVWLLVHGDWPTRVVRFKNGDKLDCRIENLVYGKFDTTTLAGRRAGQNDYRKRNPRLEKDRALRDSFGMTVDEWEEKILAQNGCCAICRKPETATRLGKPLTLSVDHNHKTGAIRDLLCRACNVLLGYANEDADVLIKAIAYLRRHNGVETNILTLQKKEAI